MDLALHPQDPVLLDATPGGAKMTFEEWWEEFVAEHDEWKYADSAALRRAAFYAGAASRDAEVARLKTVPMKYRRMAFNAQLQDAVARLEQENDQLRAQINVLREAVKVVEADSEEVLDFDECMAMCLPMDAYHGLIEAAEATPEQSLAEYRNKVIEAFVNEFSRHVGGDGEFWLHELQDFAMKEQP